MNRNACFLIICLTLWISASCHGMELVIAANPVDGKQRQAFNKQIDAFKRANPDINVSLRAIEHETFKESVEKYIGTKNQIGDILFWFGGASLRHFADEGWLRDITHLWQTNNWYADFTRASSTAVTRGQKQFGLPLYYYQWGIYYRKSIFKDLSLTPPATWSDFLKTAAKIQEAGITPFTLGSKNHWTAAGWFDYLNLRINGLSYHQHLLNGCISFTDKGVSKVLARLQEIVNKGYFIPDAHTYDWKNALPYLYHKQSAMLLMGNFFLATVPSSIRPDIGFFPFPEISSDQPVYEDAPIDVLISPANAKNPEAADRFLKFMSQAKVQAEIANAMQMIPTHRQSLIADDEQTRQGAELLGQAEGLAQFFDRDAHPDFTKQAMPLISQFIREAKNISALQSKLETIRKQVWGNKQANACLAQ